MAKRFNLNEADRDKLADLLNTPPAKKQSRAVRQQTPRHTSGGFPFINNSSQEIPPYAVLQIVDAELDRNRTLLSVVKPTSTGKLFIFNGPRTIPVDGRGIGYREGRALATVTSSPLELWSPEPDEWSLVSGGSHFSLAGELDEETGYFLLAGSGFDRIKGTLVGAMETTDATHTIDNIEVLSGTDPRTDSTSASEAITVSNADHSWEGDDNAVGRAEWNPVQERWEFYQVTCPAP
jgi:hypothetical protein